jgi:hypothetical protein
MNVMMLTSVEVQRKKSTLDDVCGIPAAEVYRDLKTSNLLIFVFRKLVIIGPGRRLRVRSLLFIGKSKFSVPLLKTERTSNRTAVCLIAENLHGKLRTLPFCQRMLVLSKAQITCFYEVTFQWLSDYILFWAAQVRLRE